jgi:uncharacterized protein (DUF1330 family)
LIRLDSVTASTLGNGKSIEAAPFFRSGSALFYEGKGLKTFNVLNGGLDGQRVLGCFADITDPEGCKGYIAANAKAFSKYGARFLARVGKVEPKEVKPRSRVVVVEFPTYSAALECYRSPEYVAAMKEREGRSVWDMAITEGYEGPQPT